jgi:hypothetical protein
MFVIAYLNNVLIYSKSFKKHKTHVWKVLEIFKQNNVKLALQKAEWY